MQNPSCDDCKNCISLVRSGELCKVKSHLIPVTYVNGETSYRVVSPQHCHDERVESKGFFGLFKDETRCGPEGKNFVPKVKK